MARVTSPDPGYNGTGPGGVVFANGVAETDDERALAYFRRRGYGIDGSEPVRPVDPEPADPRDHGPERIGARLRDAAVDPRPEDYLPPTNAGQANPHGPKVVSPGLHAGANPGPIVPGPVGDPQRQQTRETEAAHRTLVDREPVPEVTADMGDQSGRGEQPEPPAGNASQETWADWVLATHPDLNEAEVRAMRRDELRDQYGPTAE
ncbi:hypothetical protein ACQSSU_12825 [Micromonospora echinospora]